MSILIDISRISIVAFILSGLVACADPAPEVLRFGVKSTAISLDPRFATDAASSRVNRLLYRQLVDFDDGYRAIPGIATWTRVTPLRYRFFLGSEGRVFHDGSRLTADDVAAMYNSVLDEKTASPHRGTLKHIANITVIDKDTIDFELAVPDPLFPGLLVIGIAPSNRLADSLSRNPLGSGEFEFVAWPDDTRLVLRRTRDAQLVELLKVRKPTVRVLKLLRGEIDVMQNDLMPELVAWLQGRPDLVVTQRQGTNFSYIGFNMQDSIVGDPLIRQAIAYGIDRQAIIDNLLRGTARKANAILPPEHWAGNPDLTSLEYDPELARKLIVKAGYSFDRPLRIVYKTSTDPLRVRIATIIQNQLADVGITIDLQTYDWGTFYGDIKAGRFQMYSLAWVGIKMPDIFRYTMHSESLPNAGANRGRFINARADSLIETAEVAQIQEEQAQLYRELQALLLEELPYIPLWYEDHYVITNEGVEGYSLAADGNYDGLIHAEKVVIP